MIGVALSSFIYIIQAARLKPKSSYTEWEVSLCSEKTKTQNTDDAFKDPEKEQLTPGGSEIEIYSRNVCDLP